MSDTADDVGFHGRQLLNKARTDPLRERMRAFVDDQERRDLKRLRSEVSEGEPLSEIVDEGRDERL